MTVTCVDAFSNNSYLTRISQAAAGDFSTALYDVISKRSSVMEGSLSIDDVNEVLDELAKNMGKS